jgi:hypothetical protein
MKTLSAFALILAILVPTLAAQAAANFTGNWEGTFAIQRPDGTEGPPRPAVFNLVQKGNTITGTAGPPDGPWEIAKGTVTNGTATFQVQQPDGPLFKFSLKVVKDRLQGSMVGEVDGVDRGTAKVDAAKTKK